MALDRLTIAKSLVNLNGKPISYENRPYLKSIYGSDADRLVLRCSRQVEKSTTLAIMILLHAASQPGSATLAVMPRQEQAQLFRDARLTPILQESPGLRNTLAKKGWSHSARNWQFSNGSLLFMRSAYRSADSARGISADLLILDEAQDLSLDAIPVLEQALSHAPEKGVIIAGTPKLGDNPLEAAYRQGSQREWVARCPKCRANNRPTEDTLGPASPVCAKCGAPISFASGRWVARNSSAVSCESFWINHLMVPWIDYQEVLSCRETYGIAQFRNEVLGIPVDLGDHVVTPAEVEACCGTLNNAISPRDWGRLRLAPGTLTLGIDWGGGGKSRAAFALGAYSEKGGFRVLFMERRPPGESHEQMVGRACEILRQAPGAAVAADGGGNGSILNRLLIADKRCPATKFTGIFYSDTGGAPQIVSANENRWTIGRTRAIGDIFTHIKAGRLSIPSLKSCADCLPDIWGELAHYDPKNRTIRYECPAGGTDDVLHAITYCLAVSAHVYSAGHAISA